MSDTTIDTAPTRRPRSERQKPEEDAPESQVTIEPPSSEPEPEAPSAADNALADTRRLLKQAEDDRNAATARARAADAARLAAEQNANTTRISDRAGTVNANLEAGKSEVSAAKVAYAAAREAGDVAAEIAAQELLSSGNFKVQEANRELEWLKGQADRAKMPAAPEPEEYKPSAAAQRWLDEHPRFNADDDYRAAAEGLHGRALAAGKPNGSQEYVDYIEAGMTRLFGEGHGQAGGGRSKNVDRSDDQPLRGGEGMRPSGGGSSDGGAWRTARIPLGHMGGVAIVKYRGPPENRRIQFTKPEDMDNFKEGAAVSYRALYERDPNRAIADYVNDHIAAHDEGYSDMKTGDGQGYR